VETGAEDANRRMKPAVSHGPAAPHPQWRLVRSGHAGSRKEMRMFTNLLYRGLPTSLLLALAVFVQYYAIRAFA
jgi:hypothetical protein